MVNVRLLIICLAGLLFAPAVVNAAQTFVAIAANDIGEIGTGSGETKDIAIKEALAACNKSATKKCGYNYWTKSTSYMVMLHCKMQVEGESVEGALGAHDKSSIKKAIIKARRKIGKMLLYSTSYLKKEDCRVVASYSRGKFSKK
jgi:hypothetical protein